MEVFASILEDDSDSTYLLPFGDQHYHVPIENVIANSTYTNCATCGEIDTVLRSRHPERWKRCLTYGRVLRIRGVEGNALYTTFAPTDGFFDEQRVLRLVPWRVAHACLPEVKEWARCDPDWGVDAECMAVYDWKKQVDLPSAPHLNPVLNHWPTATCPVGPLLRAPSLDSPPRHVRGRDWPATPAFFSDVRRPPTQPPPLVRQPPPLAHPSRPMGDLRALSDFLFECKDLVPEGAYLNASNALKRVWDSAI